MKKTLVIALTLISVLIMVILPNISAIETTLITKTRESFIQNQLDTHIDNINRFEKFGLKSIIINRSFFEDPDGPYEGGFDDITDFLYLILFLITFPISFPLRIVDQMLIGVIGFFWILLEIICFLAGEEVPEFEYGLLFHLILLPVLCESEWKDEFDWDGDGR